MWYSLSEISCEGFVLLACTSQRYMRPWILFGVFKYKGSMHEDERWVVAFGHHRVSVKWIWNELRKERSL